MGLTQKEISVKNLWYRALGAVDWLELQRNRRKVYNAGVVIVPVLVAGGFLSSGTARDVLDVLAVLAGGGVAKLAARHT